MYSREKVELFLLISLRFDIKSPTEEDIARFLHRKK